jgi:branched-subunit amino acid aminotransferase/4-amino-4-deoxychorismate lyase
MHKFLSFNGQICGSNDANLPALSSAALYGWGVFTTIAVYGSQPFLWDKHWRRLTDSAARVDIDLSEITERGMYEELTELIRVNKISDARARITLFDNSCSVWSAGDPHKTNVFITTATFRHNPDAFRLMISPFRVNTMSPLVGIKSCNYLENVLTWERAKTAGFEEAVRLNERDEVVSTCVANIFWAKGGKLYTPSLKTGTVAGATRSFVLEQAAANGIEVFEIEAGIDVLLDADECFVTSAGIGIKSVSAVADVKFNSVGIVDRITSG